MKNVPISQKFSGGNWMKVPKMHELAQVRETQQFILYALNIEAFTSKF